MCRKVLGTREKVRRSAVEGPGPSAPRLHCREATMINVVWECSGKPVFVILLHSKEDSEWKPWNTVGLGEEV